MGQGSSWNVVIGVFEILKSVPLIPETPRFEANAMPELLGWQAFFE